MRHNGFLKTFEGADGMKTGFICTSGFNVVASATRGDMSMIAVVLGEEFERGSDGAGKPAHPARLRLLPLENDALDQAGSDGG